MSATGIVIYAGGVLAAGLAVGLGHVVERTVRRSPRDVRPTIFNIACFAPGSFIQGLLLPLAGAASTLMINRFGGGLFVLPSHGWALPIGVGIYLVATDFAEYSYHRAQHAAPLLWSLHSYHHSDEAMDISTTLRHFWADRILKQLTVFSAVAVIFRVDPVILTLYGSASVYNYVVHMDVGLGFGRWSWLLNSPRYHRLHHSRLAEHEGCNYAALLPIFDVLAGTYRRPSAGEYPPTGLVETGGPSSILEALAWPLRRRVFGDHHLKTT
jgi:sterol desaturase/sphingolipid hydroxylase (fatty acid hydroxylase superfamily)